MGRQDHADFPVPLVCKETTAQTVCQGLPAWIPHRDCLACLECVDLRGPLESLEHPESPDPQEIQARRGRPVRPGCLDLLEATAGRESDPRSHRH
mmetsp:Transcript_16130/g.38675  ORF Transcript_16130/g.38675 Transcript_16130/m.38675 type:complete len:95 (+) Transcript_16130:877-1161(+)